ncbi:MAG: glucuronate isomerase [Planctomycetota bacterium]|nr:glucuronate isomerase [Planctomycetota bacterium]MDA1178332.1 glucuronate isomerase [Planctomycetota bacterium]
MSQELSHRLFTELDALRLIDPHTHINPHAPVATNLADILGYHYYTELAHSAGLPREQIEDSQLSSKQRAELLLRHLGPIDNTIQFSWLLEMARELFGFDSTRIDQRNWESLYDAADECFRRKTWEAEVLEASKLDAVFLTNEFDDPLTGFNTKRYIPCLRTDDLVFQLGSTSVRERLDRASGISVKNAATLRSAIGELFRNFVQHGAKACAISLPPDFSPASVTAVEAEAAVSAAYSSRSGELSRDHQTQLSHFVFWTLAEFCTDFHLPFDLMIGVHRNVYPLGVHQGRDLYDSRVSLYQYRHLFNGFPRVTFPVSVLASVTNQELVSYAWIFPNVVANGHWWYSNTPSMIHRDLVARLEAIPRTKQIGYYSDMYKLEFGLPKFRMFKRILANCLASEFILGRGWSEDDALKLGTQILRDNVESVFAL